ncbi:MAG TPA: adenylate/guanylate cyclase domain-containing protein [Methylophilaceae bacterium]|nr:adenylate/guanylate cyclase domain-containing protein [Methylophilaceae bacterium]
MVWGRFNEPPSALLGKTILSLLVLAESLVCVFWIYTLSGLGDGYALMAAIPYFYIIISYSSLLVFYRLKRFEYFTFTQLVMLLVMPFFMQWVIGGFEASSGVAIWAVLSPVGALMILGTRQSTPWFILFMALTAVSWQLNTLFAGNALPIPEHVKALFFGINLSGIATILYVVMRYFQSQKERALQELAIEQGRSDKLLLNILPKSVADRLKANDERIADSYDEVTIMFADLVDFTQLSADMPPAQLVAILNQVFSQFDQLADKYGLEKIKTIGDAYMVVGGVPVARNDHATAIANMALEMRSVLAELALSSGQSLQMRIGINTGPVVAGVIGSKKFSYDLWGDTVNVASRMEHHGLPDAIQITESTYRLLADQFSCQDRGVITVKGRGEVKTYLLMSRLDMNV